MEKIKRKINLENFRNRFNSEGVSLSKNIIIPESETLIMEVSDNLPLIEGNILRYGTMLYVLRNMKDILKQMSVYRLCKRGDGVVLSEITEDADTVDSEILFSHITPYPRKTTAELIEEEGVYHLEESEFGNIDAYSLSFDEEVRFYADIETAITNGVEIGQYIVVADNYGYIIKKFSVAEDSGSTIPMIERAKHFYNFAECAKYEAENSEKCPLNLTDDIIPIPLYIEQETEDLGVFTSLIDEWVPYNRYFLGDKVLDSDGVVWTLTKGKTIHEEPVPQLLKSFYEEQRGISAETYVFVYDGSIPASAYYDMEKTYVKEDSNGDFFILRAYYKSGELSQSNWTKETDTSITEYTAITESRLNAFYKPDIDENSEILPFKVIWDTGNTDTPTLVSGGTYGDEVYYKTTVPFQGVTTALTGDGMITFTYSGSDENIIYTEAYKYTWKIEKFPFKTDVNDNKAEKLFRYIDIDFNEGISTGEKRLSEISVKIERDGTESQNVPYYKDEALIGIQDLTVDTSNLIIERGRAAAWERHSILGEVSSFDDLETYRNGFFTLKEE